MYGVFNSLLGVSSVSVLLSEGRVVNGQFLSSDLNPEIESKTNGP